MESIKTELAQLKSQVTELTAAVQALTAQLAPTDAPEVLDAKQAAVLLDTNPKQVYKWKARFKLPYFKNSKGVTMFHRVQVIAWLRQHNPKRAKRLFG